MPKCVITAAGLGKRSGLDGKFRKEMLPVYDFRDGRIVLRPIVDCIITHLMNSGIEHFVVVLDPGDSFTENYLSSEFTNIEFVYQEKKAGFGDAVARTAKKLGKEPFLLNAGDGLVLDMDFLDFFVKQVSLDPGSNHLCLMRVEDPQHYGTADCVVSGDHVEVNTLIRGLEELRKAHLALTDTSLASSKETRVAIGAGIFMEATLKMDGKLLVPIGSDIFIHEDPAAARARLEENMKEVETSISSLNGQREEISRRYDTILAAAQSQSGENSDVRRNQK